MKASVEELKEFERAYDRHKYLFDPNSVIFFRKRSRTEEFQAGVVKKLTSKVSNPIFSKRELELRNLTL